MYKHMCSFFVVLVLTFLAPCSDSYNTVLFYSSTLRTLGLITTPFILYYTSHCQPMYLRTCPIFMISCIREPLLIWFDLNPSFPSLFRLFDLFHRNWYFHVFLSYQHVDLYNADLFLAVAYFVRIYVYFTFPLVYNDFKV